MATAFTSGFRWEVKQMLEIIANGSNTYPYQKSTLSDLYRLLETTPWTLYSSGMGNLQPDSVLDRR